MISSSLTVHASGVERLTKNLYIANLYTLLLIISIQPARMPTDAASYQDSSFTAYLHPYLYDDALYLICNYNYRLLSTCFQF